MRVISVLFALLSVSACTAELAPFSRPEDAPEPTSEGPLSAIDPDLLAPAPDPLATTADALDTTTEDQRIEATSIDVAASGLIGQTVASLGDPTQPGFWLETPLVSTLVAGAVVNPETGARVAVDLRPIAAPEGSGSRISLAALRALGATLTDLVTVEVYQN